MTGRVLTKRRRGPIAGRAAVWEGRRKNGDLTIAADTATNAGIDLILRIAARLSEHAIDTLTAALGADLTGILRIGLRAIKLHGLPRIDHNRIRIRDTGWIRLRTVNLRLLPWIDDDRLGIGECPHSKEKVTEYPNG
jgi:hypothetical protein